MQTKHSRYYAPYEKAQKERKGNENGKNWKWGGTEQYLKPEMEVIKFENEDVIVTSCKPYVPSCTPPDAPDYDDWLG